LNVVEDVKLQNNKLNKKMMSKYAYFVTLICIFFTSNKISSQSLNGTEIKGKVSDVNTKEELIGAVISFKEIKLNTGTNLNGNFKFKNVKPGNYTLVCKYLGYENLEKKLTINEGLKEIEFDFKITPSLKKLSTITISEKSNVESDLFVRNNEMNSASIINSISARAIQISPDLTVAAVLQRVSSVSMERSSNGEAQYAIIRGMDKRYNYTLINGVKIPSPDNKNRYVPMDLFPSELLERLDVIKALTPSMEGDATGGAMNMIMKNAPDRFTVTANYSLGYSQIFFDRPFSSFNSSVINANDPATRFGKDYHADANNDFTKDNLSFKNITPSPNQNFGFSLGNRFLNDKFGVLVAASYQNTNRGTNSNVILPSAQPLPAPDRNSNMIFNYDDIEYREYSSQQSRFGVHTKMDYKFNNKNSLSLYGVYMNLSEVLTRNILDTASGPQRSGVGTGEVHEYNRSRLSNQNISNITLQGNHLLYTGLKLNWSAVYSLASSQTPGWSDMERIHGVSLDSNGKQKVTPTTLNKLSTRWLNNSDEDNTIYLNLVYEPEFIKNKDFKTEISGGTMLRFKHRENYYNSYALTPDNGRGGYPIWTNIYDVNFIFTGINKDKGSPSDANNYSSNENITAYYGQLKLDFLKKYQILGGVRIENTDQNYNTAAPITLVGKSGSKTYMDILPSMHLKYAISKIQNLRASYFASITRPGFFELVPYVLPGEYFDEIGNPLLKHSTADNYDLRYEYFGKSSDQILLGVFYKSITNPIEFGYLQTGTSSQAIQPQNYGNAVNLGFEMLLTKYIGKFGIRANYTFTNSEITTAKKLYYRDGNGSLTSTLVNQTRPLQGQSAHIGNFSLLFKDSKNGLDAQLAFVYTGRRISQLSPFYGLDYWQRGILQLDFSAEKRIHKKLFLYTKITNLLNSPLVVEVLLPNTYRTGRQQIPIQDNDNSIVVQRDYYYQTYLLGIRYKIN